MSRKDILTFQVSVPTTDGFLARECNSPDCGRYFKIHESAQADFSYCPYCGERFPKDELFTRQQLAHVKAQALEKARELAYGEIDKAFGRMARQFRRGPVTFKHTPIRYRAKPVVATYRDQEVDSELICPSCDTRFQVFGIFGFCPGCSTENLLIYDANIAIVRQEITLAQDQDRALRHAYSDLVSTFESFCRKKAPADLKDTNYQDLYESRRAFKQRFGFDMLSDLGGDSLLTLRRVFQKRHVHLHNNGKISERYIRRIPEDAALLGTQASLSIDEFEAAAVALRTVIDRIVALGK